MIEERQEYAFPIKETKADFAQTLNIPDGLYFTHNYDDENNIPEDNEMYGVKDYAAVAFGQVKNQLQLFVWTV